MWQVIFLINCAFGMLNKKGLLDWNPWNELGLLDFEDYDEDFEFGDEFLGIRMSPGFQNELFDSLIEDYFEQHPKTIDLYSSWFLISKELLNMTVKSGVFEDVSSVERASQVNLQEKSKEEASITVYLKFKHFYVTYTDLVFTLDKFTARGTLKVQMLENKVRMEIVGKSGEKCSLSTGDIKFTRIDKIKAEYHPNTRYETNNKCDKNFGLFRSFFVPTFLNAVKPSLEKRLLDLLNKFVRDIENDFCFGEF
jgi:hypothetical protein